MAFLEKLSHFCNATMGKVDPNNRFERFFADCYSGNELNKELNTLYGQLISECTDFEKKKELKKEEKLAKKILRRVLVERRGNLSNTKLDLDYIMELIKVNKEQK